MRIAVFGAAGRTGRLVVEKALGHGHEVVAVWHRKALAIEHPRLTKMQGDVSDFAFVRSVISRADGVVLALAGDGNRMGVLEGGVANVIHAMAEYDVRPLAVMSAAGTFDRSSSRLSLGFRLLVATTLRHTYDDLEAMERRVMASDLSWAIVRPSGLSDAPATGRYRVTMDGSLIPGMRRIARADVASLLLKAVETNTYARRAVVVTSA